MGRTRKRQSTSVTASNSKRKKQTKSTKQTGTVARQNKISALFEESFMNDDENWSIYQSKSQNSNPFQEDNDDEINQSHQSKTRLFYSSLRKRKRPHCSSIQQSFPIVSIPMLLYQREICSSLNMNKIQSKASPFLIQTVNKNDDKNPNSKNNNMNRSRNASKRGKQRTRNQLQSRRHRFQWKPSMKRIIPFTQLGTPINDAILGIDSSGSYLISIADGKRFDINHINNDNDLDQNDDVGYQVLEQEEHQNASFGDGSWLRRRRHDNHRERFNSMDESKKYSMSHPALSLRFYGECTFTRLCISFYKTLYKTLNYPMIFLNLHSCTKSCIIRT